MKAVTESDVLGGNAEEQAKAGLEKLNNRSLLPIKLLQFQTDRRPGWLGTWTRSTTFITPRRPLGQDPLSLDYSYDSDAEWEDVEEGENVDAIDEREEEESLGGSDEDSEMDDWLEDDLEEEDEPLAMEDSAVTGEAQETVDSERNALVADKATNSHVLKPKKKLKLLGRRFDAKLVPYITGPHWETTLSVPGHDSFAQFQLHMLNNAPLGLDPFKFVSTHATPDVDEKSTEPAESMPAPSDAEPNAAPAPTAVPPTARSSKFQFPDTHLQELLSLVEGSTRPKPVLIEDLREHFAPMIKGLSKAAIEARLQECAAKESKKPGAKWVVKEEWRVRNELFLPQSRMGPDSST